MNTKFDIAWEHISHWILCIVLIVVCATAMPAFLIMVGCGTLLVDQLHMPVFGFAVHEAKAIYGVLAYLNIVLVTRFWFIRGCIKEWERMVDLHTHALSRLKQRQAFAR